MIALDTNYLINALVAGSPEAAALIGRERVWRPVIKPISRRLSPTAWYCSLHRSQCRQRIDPVTQGDPPPLRQRGYREEGECVNIEGVSVQFLPAHNALVEEALARARAVFYERTPTRVLGAEHLVAIMHRPFES